MLWFFHNRFWWPPDEGLIAHIAERIAQGEILSKDVQLYHAGYIYLVNAAAFKLFGFDLLSLRYPLVLISLIQSILVFSLFRPKGFFVAIVSSVLPTALGVLQYLNPNQHWYCLFLMIVLVYGLLQWKSSTFTKYCFAGFILGNIYLFRQLSFVWAAMGVISFFLYEQQTEEKTQPFFAKGIFLVMFLVLCTYLINAVDLFGFIFIGFWQLIILASFTVQTNVPPKKTFHILLGTAFEIK